MIDWEIQFKDKYYHPNIDVKVKERERERARQREREQERQRERIGFNILVYRYNIKLEACVEVYIKTECAGLTKMWQKPLMAIDKLVQHGTVMYDGFICHHPAPRHNLHLAIPNQSVQQKQNRIICCLTIITQDIFFCSMTCCDEMNNNKLRFSTN